MIAPRFLPFLGRQAWRQRTRSVLTVAGVAAALFLFVTVQALQAGVARSTTATAADTTLVVYRANRFCPATSRLPEDYAARVRRIAGVRDVLPMKVVVSNCRAALDVITFRGVPETQVAALARRWTLEEGAIEAWRARSDAALVGERLASRRGFGVGDSFDSAGVSVVVAGIVRSDDVQDENAAYVHLDFLQLAAQRTGRGGGPGAVTQFTVEVDDPALLEQVALAIDEEFRSDAEPTSTRPERAFVAQAGADIVEIVGFMRWLGWGCVVAVFALLANAVVLAVQDRVREHAILQTLGFRGALVARLVIAEGVALGLAGGALGAGAAALFLHWGRFTLSSEGLSVAVRAEPRAIVLGILVAGGIGVLAGLIPAWQVARRELAEGVRAA